MQFNVLDRPVLDKTGITGNFDFDLKWTPDETQWSRYGIKVPPDEKWPYPSLFTAVQEQLGLKLEAKKAMTEVMVIDHIEPPSPN